MENNRELIDRESVLFLLHDAIKCLKEMELEENRNTLTKVVLDHVAEMYSKTRAIIATLPTVDHTPVVRCKDCKNRYSSEFCECRPDDAFCSDGERSE